MSAVCSIGKDENEEYLRIEKTKPGSRKNRGMQNASTTWMTPSGGIAVQYEDADDGDAFGIVHPRDAPRRSHNIIPPISAHSVQEISGTERVSSSMALALLK